MSAIPSAATIQAAFASWQEPLVEFFPRNAAPGERFFWRSAAEAASVAQQKTIMLERQLKQAQEASR